MPRKLIHKLHSIDIHKFGQHYLVMKNLLDDLHSYISALNESSIIL